MNTTARIPSPSSSAVVSAQLLQRAPTSPVFYYTIKGAIEVTRFFTQVKPLSVSSRGWMGSGTRALSTLYLGVWDTVDKGGR